MKIYSDLTTKQRQAVNADPAVAAALDAAIAASNALYDEKSVSNLHESSRAAREYRRINAETIERMFGG